MKNIEKYYARAKDFLKRYSAEIFGIIAVVLFIASFLNPRYENRLVREASRVQRSLQRQQRVMEKYALRALQTPPDTWLEMDDLPQDMVLYKYNADTLQSWVHQFPISNDEVDVYPFAYRLQYMSNRNLYSTPLAYIGVREKYMNLGSGWYVVNTQISKNRQSKVITGIFVKTEYPDDLSLNNTVNKKLKLRKGLTTAPVNSDDGAVVFGLEGAPLFSIVEQGPSTFKYGDPILRWVALVFAIFALFAFHAKNRSWASFAVVSCGLIIIRFATLLMAAKIGTDNELFSPILYANTKIFDSLGSFLFNNLFVSLLVYALFMVRFTILKHLLIRSTMQRTYIQLLFILIAIVLAVYIHSVFRSLILNSSIVMEPFKIEELSGYSVLCYLSFAMLFLALLFLLQMIVIFVRKKKRFSVLSWKNIIIYILLISLYSVIAEGIYGYHKEYESNRVWTNKLAVERDLTLELQLRRVEDGIAQDPFIGFLTSYDSREMIKNRLLERYLYRNITQKYNIEITVCGMNDYLSLGKGADPVGCFAFYQEQLVRYGNPLSPNSHFFYLNNYDGRTSYIGIYNFIDTDSGRVMRLFIEINSKYLKDELGYAGNMFDFQDNNAVSLPRQYSYAKYSNGRLISNGGRYNYAVIVNPDDYVSGYGVKNQNGFVHFINKVSEDEITMVSRKGRPFFSYIVSFSYLAIFFGVFLLICTKASRKNKFFTLPKHSFKRKINLLVTSSMIVALICMGVGSIIYSLNFTRESNQTKMDEKMLSVQTSLSEYCKYALRYNEINTPELFGAMDEVAGMMQVDINLYDTHGGLIRSTRPNVYEQFLMGKRMNNDAYKEIYYNRALRFITVESVAGMNYYSVYAPMFNADGDLVAIINIPYFSRNVDVNESNISTIATIINLYLILLIASILGGSIVSNSLSRPLAEIKQRMESLSSSSKNKHIIYKNSKDELGVLVTAYNNMVDDLEESTKQLAQSEREQAWKEMARQIAHEIKNPLTPMRLSIQHLMRLKKQNVPGWEDKLEALSRSLIEQIDVLSETASEFSSFAKFFNEDNTDIDLDEVIKEQIVIFDNNDKIKMKYVSYVTDPVVYARRKQIVRVFVNLISNAIQAIENSRGDGQIKISLSSEKIDSVSYYRVQIEDDGPGVDPSNYDKLFKPNFTTKSGGTGLGLAICGSIVEQSQGRISYATSSLGGACFTIELPVKP